MDRGRWTFVFALFVLGLMLFAFVSSADFMPVDTQVSKELLARLGEWVTWAFMALLFLGATSIIAFIVLNKGKGGGKDPGSIWARLLAGALIIGLLLMVRACIGDRDPEELVEEEDPYHYQEERLPLGSDEWDLAPEERPEPDPYVSWLAVLGILLLMLALLLGILRQSLVSTTTEDDAEVYQQELATITGIVLASLAELENEPDPRMAIIRCYEEFYRLLSVAGWPAPRHLAPEELVMETLKRFPVPKDSLATLTALFQQAKFSTHAITNEDKARTIQCFVTIRDRLVQETTGDDHDGHTLT